MLFIKESKSYVHGKKAECSVRNVFHSLLTTCLVALRAVVMSFVFVCFGFEFVYVCASARSDSPCALLFSSHISFFERASAEKKKFFQVFHLVSREPSVVQLLVDAKKR